MSDGKHPHVEMQHIPTFFVNVSSWPSRTLLEWKKTGKLWVGQITFEVEWRSVVRSSVLSFTPALSVFVPGFND